MPAKKKSNKPVLKKSVKVTKPAAKASAKKTVKPAPKKAAKPVAKAVHKKTAKPAVKVAPKKSVKPVTKKAAKPVVKSIPQKEESKKTTTATKPDIHIKPTVKKAIQDLKKDAKTKSKPVEIKPVKTSVTTSVRYQPDFTKSVLDAKAEEKPQGPMVRYSDADLTEFRDLIQRKLEAAKKELGYLQGLITRKDEMGGDDGDGRYMTMEDGTVSMEREQLSQMASRQITYIDHLEKALMRIENKTYGICRVTGKLIDKARLRAVPHATLSIEAKMGYVKGPQLMGE